MDEQELREFLEKFTKDRDFKINPDKKITDMLVKALLNNEKRYGKRLCPCRLPQEGIVCPCGFKAHEEWKKEGRCHCGLFVKKQL